MKTNRCEGWHRHGGAFTIGPAVAWEQCKAQGTVMLTFKDRGKVQTLPACNSCWVECIGQGIKIIKATPIK